MPRPLFDSHCHIIDHRFPIVANQGYTPPEFGLADYLARAKPLGVAGGAIVSGSFQARRVHAAAGWHAEIYAVAAALKPHLASSPSCYSCPLTISA